MVTRLKGRKALIACLAQTVVLKSQLTVLNNFIWLSISGLTLEDLNLGLGLFSYIN